MNDVWNDYIVKFKPKKKKQPKWDHHLTRIANATSLSKMEPTVEVLAMLAQNLATPPVTEMHAYALKMNLYFHDPPENFMNNFT